MKDLNRKIFCAILVIVGLFLIFVGINVGLGGILTLGLQGQVKFFEITNENAFAVQDSHIRFFGGLFGAMGLFMIIAVTNLRKFEMALKLAFVLIFIGGLARFSAMRFDIVFGKEIIGSLFAELVLMPILYIWLSKLLKSSEGNI